MFGTNISLRQHWSEGVLPILQLKTTLYVFQSYALCWLDDDGTVHEEIKCKVG